MRWLIRLGAGTLAAVLVVFGVGAALPVAHSAQVSREVSGSPDEVWAVLNDVEEYPTWRSDVARVTRVAADVTRADGSAGSRAWREEGSAGPLTLEVTESDPPRRLVTRIVDQGLPFGGRWTYELEPTGSGTRVLITEDGEIYNPAFRFMARFVFGYRATMETYLSDLHARMAGGAR
jgi:uncharacterized protein YndB with AHSA1/START domain